MDGVDLGLVGGLNVAAAILIILVAAVIGKIKVDSAGFGAWFGFCLSFWLSFVLWVVIVAVHFLGKVW